MVQASRRGRYQLGITELDIRDGLQDWSRSVRCFDSRVENYSAACADLAFRRRCCSVIEKNLKCCSIIGPKANAVAVIRLNRQYDAIPITPERLTETSISGTWTTLDAPIPIS